MMNNRMQSEIQLERTEVMMEPDHAHRCAGPCM